MVWYLVMAISLETISFFVHLDSLVIGDVTPWSVRGLNGTWDAFFQRIKPFLIKKHISYYIFAPVDSNTTNRSLKISKITL